MLKSAPLSDCDPGAFLRTRLSGFAGFLHANGFGLGGGDLPRVLDTAERVGIFDGAVLRWSLQALLCGRGDEWRRFDALFDAYFLPPNKQSFSQSGNVTIGPPEADRALDAAADNATVQLPGSGAGGSDDTRAERHGASREESLLSTDFRSLERADQVRDIELLMRRFARRLKRLQLRREARVQHGRRLDMQSTIRKSVASGGSPFRIAWKEHRRVRPRLVLLLDVSRSMSSYSFFYLRLARALCAELADVYCFIFHTRISAVSEALRDPDPWRSQERLHLLAEGWGGGTRIGECLEEFNRRHAPRCVHARTAVIVVSDGYDTGAPEQLAAALANLRRRARRMVWLNPLLAREDFSPEGRAMQAALPHLDLFAPGADLANLEHLLPKIIEVLR